MLSLVSGSQFFSRFRAFLTNWTALSASALARNKLVISYLGSNAKERNRFCFYFSTLYNFEKSFLWLARSLMGRKSWSLEMLTLQRLSLWFLNWGNRWRKKSERQISPLVKKMRISKHYCECVKIVVFFLSLLFSCFITKFGNKIRTLYKKLPMVLPICRWCFFLMHTFVSKLLRNVVWYITKWKWMKPLSRRWRSLFTGV